MTTATRKSNKVTKIELVVMGVILVAIFSLLLPAMTVSREVARENLCRRNLRWLDQGAQEYIHRSRKLPGAVTWVVDLLPYLVDQAGGDKHRTELEVFTMPRPMFLTCPSRPDIDRVEGVPQISHYTWVTDHNKQTRPDDATWSFRDRPLDVSADTAQPWYMGSHTTPSNAEQQLRVSRGPHRNGAYLQSDSQGKSVLRNMQP